MKQLSQFFLEGESPTLKTFISHIKITFLIWGRPWITYAQIYIRFYPKPKTTKSNVKSKFSEFFTSKIPFGGYFQGIVYTYFQKVCIWTRQEHSKLSRKTSNFLVTLLRLCFRKTTVKSKFSEFFTTKRHFSGYFYRNTYIYFKKVCSWTRYSNVKFIRETSIFLVTLLTTLKSKSSKFFYH